MNAELLTLFLKQWKYFLLAWFRRLPIIYVPRELHENISSGRRTVYQLFAVEWGGSVDGILAVEFKHRSETIHFYRTIEGIVHPRFQTQSLATMVTDSTRTVMVVHWLVQPVDPPPVKQLRVLPVIRYRTPELRPYWQPNAQGFVRNVHTPVIRIGVTSKHAPEGKLSVFAQWGDHTCRTVVDTRKQAAVAVSGCIVELVAKTELIGRYWKIQLVHSGQYLQSWFFFDLLDSMAIMDATSPRRNVFDQLWEKEWSYDSTSGWHGQFTNGNIGIPNFGENEPANVWDLFFRMNQQFDSDGGTT
ncbi:hypothetical protein KC571_02055 [candidate division WWE3 bacterium]|uniref:Uncharacterized protein n=1 Tax=candidate division WWE3 bacterium TaxID=2053526 RepID=A0A955RQ86_UNCKA|nr:hypothetical protein [candidate division WWE3 bacterium]